MEIAQKAAEEEERYKKEMEKYTPHFVHLIDVHKVPILYCFYDIYKISYTALLFLRPL